MTTQALKTTFDTGLIELKNKEFCFQFYYPIITIEKDRLTLSFSTNLVVTAKTWQFDWSAGFQILGFGFGACKYKENT